MMTRHQPQIDGLRAVAILSVVLYHVGLPLIPGGFVGVDVFFVISGYLIIGGIARGLAAGTFSLWEFWAARAIRILPPYFLVVLATAAFAPAALLFLPEFQQLGKEIAWSAMLAGNFLYLGQEGYFDAARDSKLLLHLWSLGVEEQFYLAAPLLALAVWPLRSRGRTAALSAIWALGLATALSFLFCVWFTVGGRNYAFYMMPLRAWEFALGGLAAWLASKLHHLPRPVWERVSVLGFAAIGLAMVAFDQMTHYPSYHAALPALGAAAVILAVSVDRNVLIGRFLSLRGLTSIGVVSYAWYLWHWPLLTAIRIHFGERDLLRDSLAALASLLLAIATYRLLEKPLAAWRRRSPPRSWLPATAGLAACMAVLAIARVYPEAAITPLPPRLQATPAGHLADCDVRKTSDPTKCLAGAAGKRIGVVLGDSHMGSAIKVLDQEAARTGTALIGFGSGGCSALLIETAIPDRQAARDCAASRENFRSFMARVPSVDFAILYSRWPMYGSDSYIVLDGEPGDGPLVAGLQGTVDLLRAKGARRILVIGATPVLPHWAPACVARALHRGDSIDTRCSVPAADNAALKRHSVQWMAKALLPYRTVRTIEPDAAFCDHEYCRPSDGHTLWFNDRDHLSDFGVQRLIGANRDDFDWVFLGH